MKTRRPLLASRRWLLIIILIAVLLRVAAAFFLGDVVVEMPGVKDQWSYDMLARQILAGQGFTVIELWWPATWPGEPTAHWSYLYTLYLTAVYGLVGPHPLAARLIQAVLAGVLMPWLAYRLGRRHYNGTVGLVAAALVAGYIYFVYYAATLMTETFYIIGILWTLDLAGQLGAMVSPRSVGGGAIGANDHSTPSQPPPARGRGENFPPLGGDRGGESASKTKLSALDLAREERSQTIPPFGGLGGPPLRLGLLLGLSLAITVLLRQAFLLFIPFLFAWLLWRSYYLNRASGRLVSQPVLRMFSTLLIATAVVIAAILPWTWRNYRAFDTFVLLNTNAGFALFWGNHPIHGYNFISILPSGYDYFVLIPRKYLSLNEAQMDRALLREAMTFIRDDPLRYIILSISRTKDYFKFWPSTQSSTISNISRVFSFGILWPFMLYGFIVSLRRGYNRGILILHLFAVIYTGIHLMIWALIRYRLPVDSVLLIFAAAVLVELWVKLTRRYPSLFERTGWLVGQSAGR